MVWGFFKPNFGHVIAVALSPQFREPVLPFVTRVSRAPSNLHPGARRKREVKREKWRGERRGRPRT
jgi:hypothetical protein